MKRTFKILSLAICLFLLASRSEAQSGPGANFYGVNLEPLCWHIAEGGIDSTIYAAWLSFPGQAYPSRIGYFNAKGQAVSVFTTDLYPGYCGNGGYCKVLGEWRVTSITSNTTYDEETYNSIAILAVSGTVSVSVDGGSAVPITANTVITVRADACEYVASPVTVNVSGGSATVSLFY